jgi:hypothetical protein
VLVPIVKDVPLCILKDVKHCNDGTFLDNHIKNPYAEAVAESFS